MISSKLTPRSAWRAGHEWRHALETIVFALITVTVFATIKQQPRLRIIALWGITTGIALSVFGHHVTSALTLNF
ncbi:DUF5993 family protein [Amycolatopsis sp. cmx-11-12]|uniref:DUF5993 family protein n=1 Tax=Amycolatopsis sp. cmx-11-12 TaxID=2785795 RepID=UPI00391838C6